MAVFLRITLVDMWIIIISLAEGRFGCRVIGYQ